MAEFTYNNAKNANTGYTSFEFNNDYHPCISFEEDIDPCSLFKIVKDLTSKLKDLMVIYWKNLFYTQELQKRAYNKSMKP